MSHNNDRDIDTHPATIFVVGSDDYNLDLIKRLPDAWRRRVISALTWDDVQPPSGRIDFDALYEQAKRSIDDHADAPDAIIGYLDFPVTSLVSLLIRDYGLIGAAPEAVARCEHKYWLRLAQAKVMPEQTPRFAAINPFQPSRARKAAPPFPFWLKPVKGHSSALGFMVKDEEDLENALHACRQKIHFFGEPFNRFLSHLDDTDELEGVDGNYAIAEQLISAPRQFTLEGYVRGGKLTVYGAIDSLRTGKHRSSFSRYQYPAQLSDEVRDRAAALAATLLAEIGYDNAPFNAEFFWNPDSDALHLLEINPRVSKSHAPLFYMVDGMAHYRVPIDVALGREPEMPHGNGKDKLAAKFMLRSFEADGVVQRVPGASAFAEMNRILPDIQAKVLVEQGIRLSDLLYQDSYSYELAEIFLGGRDEEMIADAYGRCCDSLEFHIQPMPEK